MEDYYFVCRWASAYEVRHKQDGAWKPIRSVHKREKGRYYYSLALDPRTGGSGCHPGRAEIREADQVYRTRSVSTLSVLFIHKAHNPLRYPKEITWQLFNCSRYYTPSAQRSLMGRKIQRLHSSVPIQLHKRTLRSRAGPKTRVGDAKRKASKCFMDRGCTGVGVVRRHWSASCRQCLIKIGDCNFSEQGSCAVCSWRSLV